MSHDRLHLERKKNALSHTLTYFAITPPTHWAAIPARDLKADLTLFNVVIELINKKEISVIFHTLSQDLKDPRALILQKSEFYADVEQDLQNPENSRIIQYLINAHLGKRNSFFLPPRHQSSPFITHKPASDNASQSTTSHSAIANQTQTFFPSKKPKLCAGFGFVITTAGIGLTATALNPKLALMVFGAALTPHGTALLLAAGLFLIAVGLAMIMYGLIANHRQNRVLQSSKNFTTAHTAIELDNHAGKDSAVL